MMASDYAIVTSHDISFRYILNGIMIRKEKYSLFVQQGLLETPKFLCGKYTNIRNILDVPTLHL